MAGLPITIVFNNGEQLTASCEEWVIALIHALNETDTAALAAFLKQHQEAAIRRSLVDGHIAVREFPCLTGKAG